MTDQAKNTQDNTRILDMQRVSELEVELHYSGDLEHFYLSVYHKPKFTKPFTKDEAEVIKKKIESLTWFPSDRDGSK